MSPLISLLPFSKPPREAFLQPTRSWITAGPSRMHSDFRV